MEVEPLSPLSLYIVERGFINLCHLEINKFVLCDNHMGPLMAIGPRLRHLRITLEAYGTGNMCRFLNCLINIESLFVEVIPFRPTEQENYVRNNYIFKKFLGDSSFAPNLTVLVVILQEKFVAKEIINFLSTKIRFQGSEPRARQEVLSQVLLHPVDGKNIKAVLACKEITNDMKSKVRNSLLFSISENVKWHATLYVELLL